jgi:hypothetical protein
MVAGCLINHNIRLSRYGARECAAIAAITFDFIAGITVGGQDKVPGA